MAARVTNRRYHSAAVYAAGVALSGALFVGPVRAAATLWSQERGLTLGPATIVTCLALSLAVMMFLRRRPPLRARGTHGLALTLALLATILVAEFFRVSEGQFGYFVPANILVGTIFGMVLSARERMQFLGLACFGFFAYLVANIVYWLFVLGPLENPSTGTQYARMGGSLATVVHLGVLIPAFAAFTLGYLYRSRHRLRPLTVFVLLLLSSVGVAATASRTGMGLMLLLACTMIASGHSRAWVVRASGVAALATGSVVLLADVFAGHRFQVGWSISAGGRLESWIAGYQAWRAGSLLDSLLGRGWGNVYPYWSWTREGSITWDRHNWFVLEGAESLVAPHNSLIWILVEGGLIAALIVALLIIWSVAPTVRKSFGGEGDRFILLGWICLIVLMLMTDVVVSSPQTALLAWIMLLVPDVDRPGENRSTTPSVPTRSMPV